MKPRLVVKMTHGKGRGVFANYRIKKGEIIEIAPVIVLSSREQDANSDLPLSSHFYAWGAKGSQSALVLGLGCLYNHSYNPNATYSPRFRDKSIVFRALKDISRGEEITHNYNGDPKNQTPIKFTKNSWWWPEQKGKHKK